MLLVGSCICTQLSSLERLVSVCVLQKVEQLVRTKLDVQGYLVYVEGTALFWLLNEELVEQ